MDQVQTLRQRLKEYLGEYEGVHVTASITGANAESADIRSLTHSDQVQSWFVVPIGVFLVLLLALRDPWSCFNLVATMVLTYAFALGCGAPVFVTVLGAEGLGLEGALLPVRAAGRRRGRLQRLPDDQAARGDRRGMGSAAGSCGRSVRRAA